MKILSIISKVVGIVLVGYGILLIRTVIKMNQLYSEFKVELSYNSFLIPFTIIFIGLIIVLLSFRIVKKK